MRFSAFNDRAVPRADLRFARACCAALAAWLAVPIDASAGVMISSQVNSAEVQRADEAPTAKLPFARLRLLQRHAQAMPAAPVSNGGGGAGGNSGGSSVSYVPNCEQSGDFRTPQVVSRLYGERSPFVPSAPTADLLDPPRAAL